MEKIVAGVDGSDTSKEALRWALDEARLRQARLQVVHAWDAPPPVPDVAGAPSAGFEYVERSGRRLSIEYALIRDINDQAWRGDRLGRMLKGRPVHVNLIPLNPTPGSKWTASRPEDEKAFVEAIAAHGVPVTIRDTRGQEIDGACGQLAATER